MHPYRYCFNSPINFTDLYGLGKYAANGYKTDKNEDVERFTPILIIGQGTNKSVSMSQISSFIGAETKGCLVVVGVMSVNKIKKTLKFDKP